MGSLGKEIRDTLKAHGCELVRHGKGDHDIWSSPITGVFFPVPVKMKSRHTANAILKQAGIAKAF